MKYFGIALVFTALIILAIAESNTKKHNSTTVAHKTTAIPKKSSESTRQSRCYSNQFQCANGQCISKNLLCNGRQDCRDGTDEVFNVCSSPGGRQTTTTERYDAVGVRVKFRCASDEFLCTSGECINQLYVCDGTSHCTDGSDEVSTICPGGKNGGNIGDGNIGGGNNSRQCLETEFQCKSGECIFGGYRCDGTAHCSDSSDEDWSICQTIVEEKPGTTQRPVITTRPSRPNQGGNNGNQGGNQGGNSDNNGSQGGNQEGNSDNNGSQGGNQGGNSDNNGSQGGNNGNQGGNSGKQGGNSGNNWERRLTPCNVPPQPPNGRWKLHRSLCDSNIECNAPLNVRTMDPGSYLVYSCDQGFFLNGTSDVLCGPGGQWIHTPKCDQIKCPDLSSSATEALCTWNNVSVSCEVPAPIGTTAELKCREGFVQEVMYQQAYKQVKCQPGGNWSPKPIQCVKKPRKVKLVLEGDMILED